MGHHFAAIPWRPPRSLAALKTALAGLPAGAKPIHHSDQGTQYCSHEYVNLVRKHGLSVSMTENRSLRGERAGGMRSTAFSRANMDWGFNLRPRRVRGGRWSRRCICTMRAGRIRQLGFRPRRSRSIMLGGLRESRGRRKGDRGKLENEPRAGAKVAAALDPSPAFPMPINTAAKGIRMAYKSSWRVCFSRSWENRWLARPGRAKGSGGPAGRAAGGKTGMKKSRKKKWSKTSSGQRNRDRKGARRAKAQEPAPLLV